MQPTFLSVMAAALAGTQHRVNVAIETASADALKVMVTADLGPTPEKASEHEVQLRAVMCRPLVLVGSAVEIEGALMKRLTQHVQALNEGMSLLDEIRSIGATVQAKASTPATEQPATPDLDGDDADASQAGGESSADSSVVEPNLDLAASF
ncbi:TPA: hypothetical protein NHR60_001841 [Pseudomonas aeruginosa]|nr:hypothetical protein [Pseudomonas aeruginosa]HCE7403413.1 hypothetical protein [Pseudomonas aeruginosa]HCE7436329.1 hypothetical protein [Pseudomonas aeruginosa]HCE7782841.1 hypothetical protein [Pseudomonas aeruginosa]HCE8015331.1 hypothetical protein [Pseudomonas aeruginosa]